MRALLHAKFAALLACADGSQARFARLSGLTPRQVNNWCRGRAAVRLGPPPSPLSCGNIRQGHRDAARGGYRRLARDPRCASRR
jgi:DNA-binding transcriptional regulator YdaS (Cro superfamily)